MLYELTMFGTFFNQAVVNRFNYLSQGEPASVLGSFGLMKAFGAIPDNLIYPAGSLFVTLMGGLSSQLKITSVVARAAALYAPTDFYERPFPTPYVGGNSGQALSPAMAYGFRTSRIRLDIDRGTKRFAGVTETESDAGGVLSAATMAFLTSVATKMSAPLTYNDEGNTVTYTPCVVGKEKYTTPKGQKAYRYYPTLAEQLDHIATGILWQPYDTVRTQTSRQYGRGN